MLPFQLGYKVCAVTQCFKIRQLRKNLDFSSDLMCILAGQKALKVQSVIVWHLKKILGSKLHYIW